MASRPRRGGPAGPSPPAARSPPDWSPRRRCGAPAPPGRWSGRTVRPRRRDRTRSPPAPPAGPPGRVRGPAVGRSRRGPRRPPARARSPGGGSGTGPRRRGGPGCAGAPARGPPRPGPRAGPRGRNAGGPDRSPRTGPEAPVGSGPARCRRRCRTTAEAAPPPGAAGRGGPGRSGAGRFARRDPPRPGSRWPEEGRGPPGAGTARTRPSAGPPGRRRAIPRPGAPAAPTRPRSGAPARPARSYGRFEVLEELQHLSPAAVAEGPPGRGRFGELRPRAALGRHVAAHHEERHRIVRVAAEDARRRVIGRHGDPVAFQVEALQERPEERSVERLDDLLLGPGIPIVARFVRSLQVDVHERVLLEGRPGDPRPLPERRVPVRAHGPDEQIGKAQEPRDPALH